MTIDDLMRGGIPAGARQGRRAARGGEGRGRRRLHDLSITASLQERATFLPLPPCPGRGASPVQSAARLAQAGRDWRRRTYKQICVMQKGKERESVTPGAVVTPTHGRGTTEAPALAPHPPSSIIKPTRTLWRLN
ncbi:hypothetical protein E2C01_039343 [Portunus trituberculatus]|uniref:Uncharacterized protein n=1 Tax=Portunus trituberculatus TaxID=210409 RepID=A0A5B7FJM2_PORTR|nr:hypothetical protein [Portunus trituberculatus]